MKLVFGVLWLSGLLVACAAFDQQPTLQPTPAQIATAPCALSEALPQIDAMLASTEFEADYLTINHQLALSIWLVDEDIDPAATTPTISANARRALLTGIKLAHRMATDVPCARSLFDAVNPMIVDRNYNSWYIDVIPMIAIPAASSVTDDILIASIEQNGSQIAYLRRSPPRPPVIADTGQSCTWAEAHRQIMAVFGTARRNVSAYLIVGYEAVPDSTGREPVYAQVQWDGATPADWEQPVVLAVLEQLVTSVACLNPPVDRLETFVVDANGRVMVYALVPGALIHANPVSLNPSQFTLVYTQKP